MDWALYDQEGAMRQWYMEIDDTTEEARDALVRSDWDDESFQSAYDTSWIFHENGLEGVVLTYPEIRSAIDNKIVSDVSLLPAYRDIRAHKACLDAVRDKAKARRAVVTVDFLKELHGLLVNDPAKAGVYRKDVPIHRTYFHEIAQPGVIESELIKVLEYLRHPGDDDLHPIELAANVHHRFMRVFPFSGISGLVGRLLLNFVAIRANYFPIVVHASDRQRYYEALRGTERAFRKFLCETMSNSLENTLRFFTGRRTLRRVAY